MFMTLAFQRSEGPDEARQRRLCRMMLGLSPEPEDDHVLPALATLGALLIGLFAWRMGHLGTVAPALTGVLVLVALGAAVLRGRRRYRHVVAGLLVLAVLLGLLGAAVYHHAYLEPFAAIAGRTASALADSITTR